MSASHLRLWFVLLGLSLPLAPAWAQRSDLSVEEQYELGLRYMKRGNNTKALEQFNRIRNYHRDDPYAVKAELAIADLHFEGQEWDQARVAYEDFLRLHPRHEDVDYVVYRLGLTAFKKAPMIASRDQTWTRQAVNTWTGYDTRFADSVHVAEVQTNLTRARDRLARKEFVIGDFYFQRDAWVAVAGRMEGMLRQYPDATDAPMALAELAVARWHLGEQDEAKELVEQLRERYPLGGLEAPTRPPKPPEPEPVDLSDLSFQDRSLARSAARKDAREAKKERRETFRRAKRRHRHLRRNVRQARVMIIRHAPGLANSSGLEAEATE
ncbi:MAG: outer membrane protein assembly factor BamD [Alphaproteobacteria bacterium]|nr:outer membrane protein assembly factor BamD [Alphaproteobacteria bacterium]